MADLPAYTGPGHHCPKCGTGGVATEYHWAGGLWAPKTGKRKAPCEDHPELARIGKGEHLCRIYGNCGYGWVEACASG